MKLPKSSHTGDPLAVVLISYLGKDTHRPKIPGNPNGIYNTPKPYSRSTNNNETSKRNRVAWCELWSSRAASLCPFQDRVVQTFVFSSRPSCIKPCRLHPTLPLLARDPSTVNDSIVFSLPPFLDDNAIFSMLPSFNNPPLSPNWKDNHRMKMMNRFTVSFAFSTICLRLRFI